MVKLKAVHLVDQGAYLVEHPWGFGDLEVDGLPAPRQTFVVQDPRSILRVTRRRGAVLAYVDADGESISAGEYMAQREALIEGSTVDDEGTRVFPSLDAEFEYRKFMARWQEGAREPDAVTKEPVELEISEVRVDSGDSDIVSMWNAPHMQRDRTLYAFDRDRFMVRLCRELCAKGGLDYDNSRTGGEQWDYLRFAKIDGQYAFDDSFDRARGSFIGTLAECKAEKARCHERVARVVHRYALKRADAQLLNAGEVALALRDLQKRLNNVYAKASSSADLAHARKRLAELVERVESQSLEAA